MELGLFSKLNFDGAIEQSSRLAVENFQAIINTCSLLSLTLLLLTDYHMLHAQLNLLHIKT